MLATAAASADGNVSDVVVGSGDDYFKYLSRGDGKMYPTDEARSFKHNSFSFDTRFN